MLYLSPSLYILSICVFIFKVGRQHIDESCFFIHSQSFCLLIGILRPMMFKVITDIIGLISTIFVTAFCSLPLFFVSSIVFHSISDFSGFNGAFYVIPFSHFS